MNITTESGDVFEVDFSAGTIRRSAAHTGALGIGLDDDPTDMLADPTPYMSLPSSVIGKPLIVEFDEYTFTAAGSPVSAKTLTTSSPVVDVEYPTLRDSTRVTTTRPTLADELAWRLRPLPRQVEGIYLVHPTYQRRIRVTDDNPVERALADTDPIDSSEPEETL